MSSKKSLRRATRHIANRCLAPYGRSSQWHCFTAPEALAVYGAVATAWQLQPLAPLLVPYSGVWHVSSMCPSALSSSSSLHWTTVSEVSSSLCAHCSALLSFSLSIPGLTGPSTDWVVSPIAEALLAVLLYSVATAKLTEPQGLPGWITQTARQTSQSLGGSRVIDEALKMSAKKRIALLRRSFVSSSGSSSLIAPFESRSGGVLLLSDEAYTKDSYVVLPHASVRAPLKHARQVLTDAMPVEATDRATLEVFVSLLESGLGSTDASRAASALLGHSTQYA